MHTDATQTCDLSPDGQASADVSWSRQPLTRQPHSRVRIIAPGSLAVPPPCSSVPGVNSVLCRCCVQATGAPDGTAVK